MPVITKTLESVAAHFPDDADFVVDVREGREITAEFSGRVAQAAIEGAKDAPVLYEDHIARHAIQVHSDQGSNGQVKVFSVVGRPDKSVVKINYFD